MLPATQESEEPGPEPVRRSKPAASRVLVLDDEMEVRNVIRRDLLSRDISVVSALEGEQAVAIYRHEFEAGRRIDAVILDLTIPGGMGGLDAFREMQAIDPDVVGIVVSGYADNEILADPDRYGFTASLCKPFARDDLMSALDLTLNAPG